MVSAAAFAVAVEASPPVEAHREISVGIGIGFPGFLAAPSYTLPHWCMPPFTIRLRMSPVDNRPSVHCRHYCGHLSTLLLLLLAPGRDCPRPAPLRSGFSRSVFNTLMLLGIPGPS